MATRGDEKDPIIGDICLYGSPDVGYGFLAEHRDGRRFGDGEPRHYWSLTDAMWMAAIDLRGGYELGGTERARVFSPDGERMALLDLHGLRYFGELDWGPIPVLTISHEDIVAAAEKD